MKHQCLFAACLALAACSSSNSGSSPAADSGSAIDSTPADSTSADSGSDAAVSTFCTSQAGAFVCIDFDPPRDGLSWFTAGSSNTGGGASVIDKTSSVSAPNSAKFTVVAGPSDQSANVSFKGPSSGTVGKQSLAFQLHIDPSCAPPAGASSGVAIVAFNFALTGAAPEGEIALAIVPDGAAIAERPRTASGLGATTLHPLPKLPVGKWVPVTLTFDPSAQTVAVGVDGAPATTVTLTALATSGIGSSIFLTVGPTNMFVMPSCALGFDNVVWLK